jgi:UDPglucose 6-dehydrogenase
MTQQLAFSKDAYEAAQGANALLIATEWKEFRSPDFARLKTLLKEPLVFDGRNLYEPALMERMGLYYVAVGRGRRPKASAHVTEVQAENS